MVLRTLGRLKKSLFKKRKKKLRENIVVKQSGSNFQISGSLSNKKVLVQQIWLVSRNTDHLIKVNSEKNSYEFLFNIDLTTKKDLMKIDEDIYDLYLFIRVPEEDISKKRAMSLNESDKYINKNGEIFYDYPIRMGRFDNTQLEGSKHVVIGNQLFNLYTTIKGNLSLAINYDVNQRTTIQIDYLNSHKHTVSFGGKLFTKSFEIEKIQLSMVGRESNIEVKMPVSVNLMKDEVEKKFGLNRYKYDTSINLNKVFEAPSFNADIYDLYFNIKYYGQEKFRLRVGKPRFRARFTTRVSRGYRGKTVFATSPYYTVKRFNLSLQIDSFDKETYEYLKKISRWIWLLRPFYRRRDIWIVGERPYKAQDTGYYFFKYMRENHPNKEVYYVIESDSPEIKNIKPYGNILYYKSKKHIKYVLMANRIISSHHPDYLYPLRTKKFLKKVKAKKIFIQHGVLGTKNIEHFYGKESPSFSTDLFLVSSDYEKSIVVNDFGYDPNEVMVTGLSRFDSLLKRDIVPKRQLLIIPTWREWLVRDDVFLESEYFDRYKNLINNSTLHRLANNYNFKVIFCLHPNMQGFTKYFQDSPVKVISQGEVDVQLLLKESAMMITDYSSVAFDFSFLNKPIIYYQFDRKRFIGKRGSHLDLDNDLPGDIVYDLAEITKLTEEYARSNFKMKKEHQDRASKFLKYKDQQSSKRIYKAIKTKIRNKPIYERILETEFYKVLFKRFRKSRIYFPIMKLFYNISRYILPVDKNLLLFESGIGRQYADSPRYIYEEILKRGLNYKKVWVCNKNIRFNDSNTIRIKRLSPSYYYYLAKAKVWINNQNFPTYIKKRPQTLYIQTWHGTPLKKMLFDIKNILGRSPDYLERVSNATKTWDYLISPSPYATDAFRSAFNFKGNIIETGYPRNDIFYRDDQNELIKVIRNRLNIPKGKKVILYAPTFRDDQTSARNRFLFEIPLDLYKMKKSLGEDYVLLIRMHVVISNRIRIDEELQDFAQNVSNYSDMQELLLIADVLITDYSSVMFDFANTKRPMLFYTYDLEKYRDEVRGFYIDFEKEAPGPLIKTTEDLIYHIINLKNFKSKYGKKYDLFYKKYCPLEDGKSSSRIVDLLLDE